MSSGWSCALICTSILYFCKLCLSDYPMEIRTETTFILNTAVTDKVTIIQYTESMLPLSNYTVQTKSVQEMTANSGPRLIFVELVLADVTFLALVIHPLPVFIMDEVLLVLSWQPLHPHRDQRTLNSPLPRRFKRGHANGNRSTRCCRSSPGSLQNMLPCVCKCVLSRS